MEALINANRAIGMGDASLAAAGGVESMSRAPWVLPKPCWQRLCALPAPA
jgi:acetyl-CoA acyltransferase